MLGTTIENSRQLYKRAKQKLEPDIHQSFTAENSGESILHQLTESILQADVERVKQLLSDDVKLVSDGGPKTSAARNIISGKEDAYKLLKAIYGKYFPEGSSLSFTTFNHRPAILYKKDHVVYRCILFEIVDGLINHVYIIVNPDKLMLMK
jgi:RNA polymerase sigma-70 factor (ECF subfamily)